MSATLPQELSDELGIKHTSKVLFSKGQEGGYTVAYTLWLPVLAKDTDGSASVEADIPADFASYDSTFVMKPLYHATYMMRTGSRCTIVYLNSHEECKEFMTCFRRIIEDYHGVEEIWLGKITSDVDAQQWTTLLIQF